jgi:peptidoglycan hydrolase CwlO-like protein
MRAFLIFFAVIFAGIGLFAENPSIIELHEEILSLANKRHELVGKNLSIRGEMLKILKQYEHVQGEARNEVKEKLQPLRNELRRNQQEIRTISKSIQEKRKILAGMMKTQKMHGKDKAKEPDADISNVD